MGSRINFRSLRACWVLLLFVGGMLPARVGAGQHLTTSPVSSYQPRYVQRLAHVPEPPGGLIPYRAGLLWGYADSTGRVVIAPFLAWPYFFQIPFFDQGFIALPPPRPEEPLGAPGQRQPKQLAPEIQFRVMNARGEILIVHNAEVAVLQPDSSLVCVPEAQAINRVALVQLGLNLQPWEYTGFNSSGFRRYIPDAARQYVGRAGLGEQFQRCLGMHRVALSREIKHQVIQHVTKVVDFEEVAMATEQGRLLVGYDFAAIRPFSEGRAVVAKRVKKLHRQSELPEARQTYRFGYIDILGRKVIPIVFNYASAFRGGRATVKSDDDQYGIIDLSGRYLLRLQPHPLSDPDEAGFIRESLPDTFGMQLPGYSNWVRMRYLAPPGKPSFPTVFDEAGPFWQGRAWVRQGQREGLIDPAGQWVTLLAYDQLIFPASLNNLDEQAANQDNHEWRQESWRPAGHLLPVVQYPAPDSIYLVGRRAGKYGLVDRRTGAEVVPAIYDAVLFNACQGMACLRRDGQDYLVAVASGKAVAATYLGVDFLTPAGRRLYVTGPKGWALADTTARLCTAWIPGTGYPTPEGWLLCADEAAKRWSLCSPDGQIVYTSTQPIRQPEYDALWARVEESWSAGSKAPYWRIPLARQYAATRGLFFVAADPPRHLRILAADLRELAAAPLPTESEQQLQLLPGGWSYQGSNEYGRVSPQKPFQLISDTGLMLPLLAAVQPAYFFGFDYARAWYAYGVVPTSEGYLTRGGRKLWRD